MVDKDDGADERNLPPIGRIIMPEMKIMSTRIRWLSGVGYLPKEIAPYLGVRYQQVRNVLENPPKRAAREDIPPLKVEVMEVSSDNLEHMDRHAMEQQVAASKAAARKEQRGLNKKRRDLKAKENAEGNEELDQEDYVGREA